MIYAKSDNEDKETSLEHVQPGMQKPQHSSINFAVPNKTSIHTGSPACSTEGDQYYWSPSVLHDGLSATNISTCENLCKIVDILLVKI